MADAYTRLFHEWLEPFYRAGLNGTQHDIVLCIARHSYGMMGEKFAELNWYRIAKETNRSLPNVFREGKALIERKILHLDEAGRIGIQKRSELWHGCEAATIANPQPLRGRNQNGCEAATTPPIRKKKETVPARAQTLNGQDVVTSSPPSPARAPSPPAAFEAFWTAYPRKLKRKAALLAWRKLNPSPELVVKMLKAIEAQKQSKDWLKEDGQFIPHPTTWLNQERWTDELNNDAAVQPSSPRANRDAVLGRRGLASQTGATIQ